MSTAPHCNALNATGGRCLHPLPAPGKACAAGHVHTVRFDEVYLTERLKRIADQSPLPPSNDQTEFTPDERAALRALLKRQTIK